MDTKSVPVAAKREIAMRVKAVVNVPRVMEREFGGHRIIIRLDQSQLNVLFVVNLVSVLCVMEMENVVSATAKGM